VFAEDSCEIRSGDTLLVYTDGVTELVSSDGKMYEADRLRSVLVEASSKYDSASGIRDPILSDISYFKDKAPQLDDLSFVVARIREL
jgi:sigma-B regulation protein RsbU (phosphoserine phosphatase)